MGGIVDVKDVGRKMNYRISCKGAFLITIGLVMVLKMGDTMLRSINDNVDVHVKKLNRRTLEIVKSDKKDGGNETTNENDEVYSMYLMEERICYTSTAVVDCKDDDDNVNVTKEEGGGSKSEFVKSLYVNRDYHLEKSYLDGRNDDDKKNDDGIKNQSEKQSTLVIHVGPNRSGKHEISFFNIVEARH